jgi:hypothetical protein
MLPDCPDLERFLRGEIAAADFSHRDHVRMAYELLCRRDFAESVWRFSHALRTMAAKAGKPQAFNQTITVAFLSLIAERREAGQQEFAAFARTNDDLFGKNALARWYSASRLTSERARRIFLLPEPVAGANAAQPLGGASPAAAANECRRAVANTAARRSGSQATPPRPPRPAARGPQVSPTDHRPSAAAARCR